MRWIARVGLAGVLGVVALGGSWNAISAQAPAASMYGDLRWRMIGPYRGGRTEGRRRSPVTARPVLHRRHEWRRLEDHRLRPHLDADLRRSADRLDRRAGCCAIRPRHHLRRERRRSAAPRPLDRRRHLQVHRRRTRPGRTSACATASRFRRLPSIRTIRTGCSWRCWATPTARTRNAASSARPTAARTFQKVLYKDENTGGVDVVLDPANPNIVYAVLWESRQGPWENGVFTGPNSGLFKSTDGGTTWRQIGGGLPTVAEDGLGRIGIAVAPSMPPRLFATVERETRAGSTGRTTPARHWSAMTTDERVAGQAARFRRSQSRSRRTPTSSTSAAS